ncbi:MAG TPA: hypothetical protein VGZ32_15260 [Actinocrinis sp.]|jgi:hypothetical protein|uniref:hypothetical protein n=1 Tax=Actinocrinis sp. TaxID=1920516 RepID=UPI002DDC96B8|nr:hypothetical protein [Actinocrinis sp.]HEV3171708.1 hypothetical protein [Actinocrinis sp.]
MTTPILTLSLFELCVAMIGALATSLCALTYFRRVRIERPAIGTFNGRDIGILFVFLVTLPTLYLLLPRWALTGFLALTFLASLSIGFRPLFSPGPLWLGIGVLLGANIWIARTMLGTVAGWQLFWAENSVVVLLGAVAVANLYVQGGMKLRHVAWFALLLAGYDLAFTAVVPVTNDLAQEFLGFPLDPSMGMRMGFDNASIGLGDLLVYALFTVAAYKAYGRVGASTALGLVAVFGAALPALAPLLINFVDARTDVLVPAQTWFGPAAFLGYRWLRHRYGRERTTQEFLATLAPQQMPAAVPAHVVAAPAPQPAPLEPTVSR